MLSDNYVEICGWFVKNLVNKVLRVPKCPGTHGPWVSECPNSYVPECLSALNAQVSECLKCPITRDYPKCLSGLWMNVVREPSECLIDF